MELKGSGFTLREWRTTDAESLQKHADNKNISCFLLDRFPSPYTIDDATAWISSKLNQNPVTNFAIDIEGNAVGVIGLDFRGDVYHKSPLLGYWIGEMYWGQGIMTEAIMLLTRYAFARLDIMRIQAGVLSNNPGSMRVLQKAGYTKEGVLKNNIVKNGVILDEHIYAAVAAEMPG